MLFTVKIPFLSLTNQANISSEREKESLGPLEQSVLILQWNESTRKLNYRRTPILQGRNQPLVFVPFSLLDTEYPYMSRPSTAITTPIPLTNQAITPSERRKRGSEPLRAKYLQWSQSIEH